MNNFRLKNPKPLRKLRIFGENWVKICFRTDLDTNFGWLFWQFFKDVYGLTMNIILINSKFELKTSILWKYPMRKHRIVGNSVHNGDYFYQFFGFRLVKYFQYLLPCFVTVNLLIHKYDIFIHLIPDFYVQNHVYLVTEMVLRFFILYKGFGQNTE